LLLQFGYLAHQDLIALILSLKEYNLTVERAFSLLENRAIFIFTFWENVFVLTLATHLRDH
jgi:hypothetical protein